MLELYQFEDCPYSHKVRKYLSHLQIDYVIRNVSEDKSRRSNLIKLTDQHEVPTLFDTDQDVIISDDEEIIEYLKHHYT